MIKLREFEGYIRLLVILLISAVVLTFSASSNTLLYQQHTYDYTVFKIIGDGWADGLIPYKDLFDHKGPVLYLIQLVGSWIPIPKVGLWVLELIWLTVTLEMLFRCGRFLGATKGINCLSVCAALLFYALCVGSGNTVEGWSLPFEVLPLLLILRSLNNNKSLFVPAFITGLCFGIVAMIRINNNAVILGLLFGMCVYLCYKRDVRTLMCCMGWFLLGLISIIIPIVIYFQAVGALDDMIYSIFIFNIGYMRNFPESASLYYNSLRLLPCVIFFLITILYSRQKGLKFFIVLSPIAITTFLTFAFGFMFTHYFLMALPIFALSIQMLSPLKSYYKLSTVIVYAIYGAYILNGYGFVNKRINYINQTRIAEKNNNGLIGQQFIEEYIPDCDKGSIYTYGTMEPAGAVNATGHLPVGKYFFIQYKLQAVDQRIHDDILANFRKANPKWIISQSSDMSLLEDEMKNYEEIPEDLLPSSCPTSWHVYLRKESL